MFIYEINDISFFIKSYQSPSSHFNVYDHVTFSHCSTRPSKHSKLLHINSSSNTSRHFYFCRLPRLWNALPYIDPNLPLPTIKNKLHNFLWQHFISNFDSNSVCTFHYVCPCSKCTVIPKTVIVSQL